VVTLPLVLLAIPSVIIGFIAIEPMLFGDFFKGVIFVEEAHHAMEELKEEFHGPVAMAVHALTSLPFWLALAGVAVSYFFYMVKPAIPAAIKAKAGVLYDILDNKYYMDKFNDIVFAGGARVLGGGLWKGGDRGLIDGLIVNGSAKLVGWASRGIRLFQTGYIYHYAFVMILGVVGYLGYLMFSQYVK
jgi:NADH-quinone oxidoreductase subunit L